MQGHEHEIALPPVTIDHEANRRHPGSMYSYGDRASRERIRYYPQSLDIEHTGQLLEMELTPPLLEPSPQGGSHIQRDESWSTWGLLGASLEEYIRN